MKTILVADDEFDVLNSIKIVLESEGYKVVTCANGQEAQALLNEIKPDLLLTDSIMPLVTGFEILQGLAKSRNRVPAILMSHVQPHFKQRELKWEAILMKPFTLEQLVSTVKRVISS